MKYFVYIVQCSDDTLYTGITTDVVRRIYEHNGDEKGAKYTKMRQPVKLVYSVECANRSQATKEEMRIKNLNRRQKDLLICGEIEV
ncbi:MAG: GIY-YIG nuclease family protein [Patescibacteria group bacterium]|nr:GIY-YIG nuclease family protein [Patescibacteria group bacterium]